MIIWKTNFSNARALLPPPLPAAPLSSSLPCHALLFIPAPRVRGVERTDARYFHRTRRNKLLIAKTEPPFHLYPHAKLKNLLFTKMIIDMWIRIRTISKNNFIIERLYTQDVDANPIDHSKRSSNGKSLAAYPSNSINPRNPSFRTLDQISGTFVSR